MEQSRDQYTQNHPEQAPDDESSADFGQIIAILSVAAIIGAFFAAIWLRLMPRIEGKVVKYSLIGNAIIVVVAMVVTFAVGVIPLGVVLLIYIVILAVWCYYIRDRIPMAEATLQAASRSLLDNHGPIVVAYAMAVALILFSAFWAFTFTAVFFQAHSVTVGPPTAQNPNGTRQGNEPSAGMKAAFVFLIFSFYWSSLRTPLTVSPPPPLPHHFLLSTAHPFNSSIY